jgi:hypothetical protein
MGFAIGTIAGAIAAEQRREYYYNYGYYYGPGYYYGGPVLLRPPILSSLLGCAALSDVHGQRGHPTRTEPAAGMSPTLRTFP